MEASLNLSPKVQKGRNLCYINQSVWLINKWCCKSCEIYSKVLLCSESSGTLQKSLGGGAVKAAGFCGWMLFSVYLPSSVSYFLNGKKFFFERKQVILCTKPASQGIQVQSPKQRS